jgi:hypothetical protein
MISPGAKVDAILCPLCAGTGKLLPPDVSRIARLSAEETFRQVMQKNQQNEDAAWQWYEAELIARWGRNLGDGFGAAACRPVLTQSLG